MRSAAVTSSMIDEMHQKITTSFQSMKGNVDLFKKLHQASATWHTKLQEAMDAQADFFRVLDTVASRAHAAPAMSELGVGFNNLSDCARGLTELQRDVQRSLSDEVVVPLGARVPVDARNVQRMEKEYSKYVTEQVEGIHRAEKELDRLSKRVRKNPADAQTMLQLRGAQRIVAEQTQELDALRAHTLKRVMTEERSRYAKLMVGLLDVFKVQVRHYQRSVPALTAVIRVCQPISENPGELPQNFNPMKKRGGSVAGAPGRRSYDAGLPPVAPPGAYGLPAPPPGGFAYVPQQPPRMRPMQQMPPPPEMAAQPFRPAAPPAGGGLAPNQFVAKYPFVGQEAGQLSFAAGHVIECVGGTDENWQYGHNIVTGKQGWFPVSFLDRKADGGHVTGAVELPPVDYDEDGPAAPSDPADGGDADSANDPAKNFTGM